MRDQDAGGEAALAADIAEVVSEQLSSVDASAPLADLHETPEITLCKENNLSGQVSTMERI